MSYISKVRLKLAALRQDQNLVNGRDLIITAAGNARRRAPSYFLRKIPIIQWLPLYSWPWLVDDLLAGISVGMLMLPQSVIFSGILGITPAAMLMSTWVPAALYAFLGSSREMFSGPSLSATLSIAATLQAFPTTDIPAQTILAVLSLCTGLWSLIFGLLNLGFLFDLLSLPIVIGVGSGLGIVAYVGQFASLLGITGVSPLLTEVLGQLFSKLTDINLPALGLGVTGIVFLSLVKFMGKKLGTSHKAVRILVNARVILVVVIYTTLSFFINGKLAVPVWPVLGELGTPTLQLQPPNVQLFQSLFLPSFLLWLALALEHVLLAKSLGRTRNYTIDSSQELVFLGVANIANSFLGGMPVSGDITRACIATTSGVKSPLSSLAVAGTVVITLYTASGATQWLPGATVAAIIIPSVMSAMPPTTFIGKFWKISFADFGVLLMTFDVTMLMSTEDGVAVGFGITLLYTLLRAMFSYPDNIQTIPYTGPSTRDRGQQDAVGQIMPGMHIIRLERDIVFLNSERTSRCTVRSVMAALSGELSITDPDDRAWNDYRAAWVRTLRQDTPNPPRWLRVLVLDFSATSFIDASGMQAMEDIKTELQSYGGSLVEFRFVGMNPSVTKRFQRAGWNLASPYDADETMREDSPIWMYDNLESAVSTRQTESLGGKGLTRELSYGMPQDDSDNIPLNGDDAPG
ncbi:sulfate transporter family-domain-containing protein [Xylariales sp. PMI_506]|nr:sulfate transporter family-domain-containing protein [Xylariales sp. PMI_506]